MTMIARLSDRELMERNINILKRTSQPPLGLRVSAEHYLYLSEIAEAACDLVAQCDVKLQPNVSIVSFEPQTFNRLVEAIK